VSGDQRQGDRTSLDVLVERFQRGRISRRQFSGGLLAAGLSLPAVAAVLEACGGGGGNGGKTTLQWWKFAADHDDGSIRKAIGRWNKQNPDIQVNFQTFPVSDYEGAKLTTAFASGTGPDMFWISAGAFLDYVNSGVAQSIDDLFKNNRSQYLQAAIDAVTVNGKIYAIPFEMEPVALYYRKDLLDKAGITPPQTWTDLLDAAQKLTTGHQQGIVIEPSQGVYQNFTWYPFLWSAGGEVVSSDWKSSALRTPAAASAFDLWGQLVNKGYAPKKTSSLTADSGPLGRGEAAMQVCGFWAIAQLKSGFPGVPFGITRIPVPSGGKPVTVYGGWRHMLSSRSQHLDAAKKFASWLWMQDEIFPKDWACQTNTKYSPRKPVNDACSSVFDATPADYFTNQVLPTARAEPRYPDQIVKAVGDGIQAAMFQGKSGQEAASLAADGIDAYLKNYKGAH
jgi:multiple sugar transport system substrate-binding protein